ncbi:MAG: penicillin-binding protein activator LpoB [Victivallales bacterium]|nr:penicillin-binding protein activator LpoB [Victivallales bacterium]
MKIIASMLSMTALILLASCSSLPPVELTAEDFAWAAEQTTTQMLQSRCLDKPTGGRYVVVISRVTNDTNQYIDTDLLIKKIRVSMLNSGKAVITTAVGLTGPEDEMSAGVRGLGNDENFNQATVAGKGTMIAPDLSVSGKIIERHPNAGTKFATVEYYFQLSLTDIRTGLAIWEGEQQITK